MFVERNDRGEIIGAWTCRRYATQEAVADNDISLIRYMGRDALGEKLLAVGLSVDDIVQAAKKLGVYVDRDIQGSVVAVHDAPLHDGHELASRENPEVVRFQSDTPPPKLPDGFSATYVNEAIKWRVVRMSDLAVLESGLDSLAACAAAAKRFATARKA
jgi:hypothetical protein